MDNPQDLGRGHRENGKLPSSYDMNDPEIVFRELGLNEGVTFLDIGCGAGDYSIGAARRIGPGGMVIALDRRQDILDHVEERFASEGLVNISTIQADLTEGLPIEDGCVDVCMISTVLHCIDLVEHGKAVFKEVHRVLRTGGRVVIIECGKDDLSFGPPLEMRISPEDIDVHIGESGLERDGNVVELGFNYLVRYHPIGAP